MDSLTKWRGEMTTETRLASDVNLLKSDCLNEDDVSSDPITSVAANSATTTTTTNSNYHKSDENSLSQNAEAHCIPTNDTRMDEDDDYDNSDLKRNDCSNDKARDDSYIAPQKRQTEERKGEVDVDDLKQMAIRSGGVIVAESEETSSNSVEYPLHQLHARWCLWLLVDRHNSDWKSKMKDVHEFDTVEGFWCMHRNIHSPSSLNVGDYYMFRKHIQPDWNESIFQKGGGRFILQFSTRHKLLDHIWLQVALKMLGESLDESKSSTVVCGMVAASRFKITKLSLWIATSDPHRVIQVGRNFINFVQSMATVTQGQGSENRIEMKADFESFHRNTPLDCFFEPEAEKLNVSWSDMQKIKL